MRFRLLTASCRKALVDVLINASLLSYLENRKEKTKNFESVEKCYFDFGSAGRSFSHMINPANNDAAIRSRNCAVCSRASSRGFDMKETSASTLGASMRRAARYERRVLDSTIRRRPRRGSAYAAHKPRLNVPRKLARFGHAISRRYARDTRVALFPPVPRLPQDAANFAFSRAAASESSDGARSGTQEKIRLDSRSPSRFARVRVNRDEEVCSPRIGYRGPLFERDETVRVARQYHLDIGIISLDVRSEPSRYIEH